MSLKQKRKRCVKDFAQKWKSCVFCIPQPRIPLPNLPGILQKYSWNLAQTNTFTNILLDGIFYLTVGFHFCAFHYAAARFLMIFSPFGIFLEGSQRYGRRTSRPSQPRPRAGRFSARGRARRAPPLQSYITRWNC